jgi:hypothetical protein
MIDDTLAYGLESVERRMNYVRWCFIGVLSLTVIMLLFAGLMQPGQAVSMILGIITLIWFLLVAASFILVLIWIHRAHSNLRLIDPGGLEFTPGWAVGWYFVPIANLFKPYHAMRELWTLSQGLTNRYGDETPSGIKLWWGFWIAGNLAANLIGAFAFLSFIPAAYFLYQLMKTVTVAQRSAMNTAHVFA